MLKLIIILDFFYVVNEWLLERDHCAVTLVASTALMIAGSLTGIGFLYHVRAGTARVLVLHGFWYCVGAGALVMWVLGQCGCWCLSGERQRLWLGWGLACRAFLAPPGRPRALCMARRPAHDCWIGCAQSIYLCNECSLLRCTPCCAVLHAIRLVLPQHLVCHIGPPFLPHLW